MPYPEQERAVRWLRVELRRTQDCRVQAIRRKESAREVVDQLSRQCADSQVSLQRAQATARQAEREYERCSQAEVEVRRQLQSYGVTG